MLALRRWCWTLLVVPLFLAGGLWGVRAAGGSATPVAAPHTDGAPSALPSSLQEVVAGSASAAVQAPQTVGPRLTSPPARPVAAVQHVAAPRPQATGSAPSFSVAPVSYDVTLNEDALLPGSRYTVRGFSYTSRGAREVALLLHGFGFGHREWDLPVASPDPQNPYVYSTARYLAAHGIDAIAIDELGIGSSDHPAFLDARLLTIPAYASMTHQIVASLHARYQKVVLVGGSSGGEIANVEAGRYRDVDGLVNAGFCDLPLFSPGLLAKNLGPLIALLIQPYAYFGGTVEGGDRLNFSPEADPAVVAMDDSFVEQVPSSYAHSLVLQLGKALDPLVNVPVLVAFGQEDAAWLPACQTAQAALYLTSPSVSTFLLPSAGHALVLHPNAGAFESELVSWLKDH